MMDKKNTFDDIHSEIKYYNEIANSLGCDEFDEDAFLMSISDQNKNDQLYALCQAVDSWKHNVKECEEIREAEEEAMMREQEKAYEQYIEVQRNNAPRW